MNAGDQVRRRLRLPEHGWRRSVALLALVVLGLALYSWLHNLAGADAAAAAADNARTLQSVERSLNLNIELAANQWLAENPVLAQAAVFYYRLYYLPLAAVLLWVVFFRADVFATLARTLIVMAPLALLVFWLLPMSPPRYALPGIVDIVAQYDPFGRGSSRDLSNGKNHFSAMPSLHVGWSALCAYIAWLAARDTRPRLALLAWLFPAGMVGVVITTGNHYVLDVVGSAVLLTTAITVATVWARLRAGDAGRGRQRFLPPAHDDSVPRSS
jgi:membrane-associated phospholipid phosphatase